MTLFLTTAWLGISRKAIHYVLGDAESDNFDLYFCGIIYAES